MLRVRTTLYSWLERSILTLGWLRADRPGKAPEWGRLVFVCTGNICRSPYAEAAARRRGLNAVSCGIDTQTGLPANATAIDMAQLRGVDLRLHTTTRWEDLAVSEGDLIVAMQLRHAYAVLPRARAAGCRLVMFSSLLWPHYAPIRDPYGHPREQFQQVFDLLDTGIGHAHQLFSLKVSEAQ
jgi:protein-tyrosine phosphatase